MKKFLKVLGVIVLLAVLIAGTVLGYLTIDEYNPQDVETLAGLYIQMENNTVMQTSLMSSVSRGNTMPRMYEVFSQLTDKIQSINKQILEPEQRIRKTYVDLKFEVRDKQNEDGNNSNLIGGPTAGQNNSLPDGSVIVTNAKDLISEAKRVRIEALKNAKETKFEEQND